MLKTMHDATEYVVNSSFFFELFSYNRRFYLMVKCVRPHIRAALAANANPNITS